MHFIYHIFITFNILYYFPASWHALTDKKPELSPAGLTAGNSDISLRETFPDLGSLQSTELVVETDSYRVARHCRNANMCTEVSVAKHVWHIGLEDWRIVEAGDSPGRVLFFCRVCV